MATVTLTRADTSPWTCPAGVYQVTVECWGAGGAGGGNNATSNGGGGGGGGAYAKKVISTTPGATYAWSIGAGGTGVANGNGNAGGDTTWQSTVVVAKGGNGGQSNANGRAGGAGGLASASTGDVKYDGGTGEYGRSSNTGRGGYGGSSAGTGANGYSGPTTWSTAIYPTASTPTGAGHGGDGGDSNGANGSAPVSGQYGGGGGGSAEGTNVTGGAGADGKIILTYSDPVTLTATGVTVTISGGTANTKLALPASGTALAITGGTAASKIALNAASAALAIAGGEATFEASVTETLTAEGTQITITGGDASSHIQIPADGLAAGTSSVYGQEDLELTGLGTSGTPQTKPLHKAPPPESNTLSASGGSLEITGGDATFAVEQPLVETTTLGVSGTPQTTPLWEAPPTTWYGTSTGTAVAQGFSKALHISDGVAEGTSTATSDSSASPTYTTLGLGGFSSSAPTLEYLTSDTGDGLAQGTSTAYAYSDNAIVEDIGTPDYWQLGPVTTSSSGSVYQQSLTVTPTGGLSLSGTGSAAKGFIYSATGGLTLRGTVAAVKSRTVTPSTATRLTFSGTGSTSGGVTKSYEYFPSGGITFAGSPTLSFYKDYGPGAVGKIRDKRRLTFSTRSYSRG